LRRPRATRSATSAVVSPPTSMNSPITDRDRGSGETRPRLSTG
jgi:hypothetical protein